ncbi:MAG: hypothetical protein J7L31_04235 [Thermoplasmata archaeon]|nr:hypothetical protein [Thermoplasmata archaeon]
MVQRVREVRFNLKRKNLKDKNFRYALEKNLNLEELREGMMRKTWEILYRAFGRGV